ncbi:MAG: M20/M25/M40 family metallo-hydrolase [Chloroflexota bacterium]
MPTNPHPLSLSVDWPAVTAEATSLLSQYIQIDSSHPVGATTTTAAFIADLLATEHIQSTIFPTEDPNKVNLIARIPAERPTGKAVLLSSHMDVVQARAEDWTFDPFGGEVADGYVRGRGTLDMKGMGVMEIVVALTLRRMGVPLSRDIVLMATCDEEVGSVLGAKVLTEQHYDLLDPDFVLDEGGCGMHGFFQAGTAFTVSVGEKRILWAKLVAEAEPGHASMPWDQAATHRLVRAAHKLLSQPPEDRDSPAVAEMLRRIGGEAAREELYSYRATRPLLRDTISLTMMQGGYKINVLPERAEMSIDCRLLPDTDERAFVSNLEQLISDPGVRVEVTIWPNAADATSSWAGPEFAAVEAACSAYVPDSIVTPSLFVAGTDGRFFRARGVPAYGLVPCVLTGDDLKGYHGIDERISVANLELGARIIFDIVARLATRVD